jgi:hypothetical protein
VLNQIISTGKLPYHWLESLATLVPKVSNPKILSYFQPISVTPLLCRIAENLVVTCWLCPAVNEINVHDEFAFRPTDSITAA